MKNFYSCILLLLFAASPISLIAQTIEATYEGERLTLTASKEQKFLVEEPVAGTVSTFLTIRVDGRTAGTSVDMTLTELGDGTASLRNDYLYTTSFSTETIDDASSQFFTVGINILSDKNIETDEVLRFNLVHVTGGTTTNYPVSITIKDKEDPSKAKPDSAYWSFKIITGSNFDFFDAPTFKNFAGDLNIFAPGIWSPSKKTKIGLSFGIYSYTYFEADSSKGSIRTERYLTNASILRVVADTTKYVRETYAVNQKTTYSNRGIYLNPLVTLHKTPGTDIAQVYLNMHLEVQARTEVMRPTKVSIRKDSMLVTKAEISQGIVLQAFPGIQADYQKRTFYDTNIGIGLPIKVNIKKLISLYVHPTAGFNFYENITLKPSIENGIERTLVQRKTDKAGFFLFKGQIITMVAPVDIALGWEYRKVALRSDFLAMYLGAAISLDKLMKK